MEELVNLKDTNVLAKATASTRQVSIQTRIDAAIAATEQRIIDLKRAGEIIANNPDLEELIEIVKRNSF
jgi:hypothetical protein